VQNSKLSPANWVILVAGAVMLIGSFLPFYKGHSALGGSASSNAWSSGQFLIATLPALLGVLMAVQVALVAFAKTSFPERVLGFTWDQIHLALGFQVTIMMLFFLIRDPDFGFNIPGVSIDRGIGLFLMLLAAIGLLVGAIMRTREGAPTAY
jgi:hypothetical protein